MVDFFGKYRGVVINNVDPEILGRIQVNVPEVLGENPGWAMPCVPYAGPGVGFYAIPPVGANVWVEFEKGNADFPIWSGCFWGSAAEVPSMARIVPPSTQCIIIQTALHGIAIGDQPGLGGVMIWNETVSSEGQPSNRIFINNLGIDMQNGLGSVINMLGPSIIITGYPVVINDGALEVR